MANPPSAVRPDKGPALKSAHAVCPSCGAKYTFTAKTEWRAKEKAAATVCKNCKTGLQMTDSYLVWNDVDHRYELKKVDP